MTREQEIAHEVDSIRARHELLMVAVDVLAFADRMLALASPRFVAAMRPRINRALQSWLPISHAMVTRQARLLEELARMNGAAPDAEPPPVAAVIPFTRGRPN